MVADVGLKLSARLSRARPNSDDPVVPKCYIVSATLRETGTIAA